MSFRHDKVRGNHPITPKKGIKETDLTIKEKGMNDTITVGIKPSKTPDALLGNMHWQWNKLSVEKRMKMLQGLYFDMDEKERKRIASLQDLNDVFYGNHAMSSPGKLQKHLTKEAEFEKRVDKENDDFVKRFNRDPEMHTLKPYLKYGMYDIAVLRNIPPSVVHELFGKKNYINPIYLFHGNVTQESIIDLVSKHHGTFEADWVPKQSHRNDWRLELTGFTINIPESEANELKRKLKPDEFWKTQNGWRFWWD